MSRTKGCHLFRQLLTAQVHKPEKQRKLNTVCLYSIDTSVWIEVLREKMTQMQEKTDAG